MVTLPTEGDPDAVGNLYGTTEPVVDYGFGEAFKITPEEGMQRRPKLY